MVALFLWQQQSYLVVLLQRVKICSQKDFLKSNQYFCILHIILQQAFELFSNVVQDFNELWATELHHNLMNFSGATIAQKESFKM